MRGDREHFPGRVVRYAVLKQQSKSHHRFSLYPNRLNTMTDAKNDWISARAYALWELDGQAHGKDVQHWQQAAAEYERRARTRASVDGADVKLMRAKSKNVSKGVTGDPKLKASLVSKKAVQPVVRAEI